ncbi:MAG: glycoside hydrolase family 16 protein, partial [Bacteroidales bacterium]
MNKKTLFTTFLICVALFNCHDTFAAYCTGFGTSTRTTNDRKLNSFSLSDGINTTTVTVNQSAANGATVYFDKTATVFTTSSGAQITPSANWTGEWMHGYIWIDYNKDEVFTPKLGATGVPEVDSELVSYTCAGERNSKGESVSGDNTPAELNHLPFTIPSTLAPGNYRARFIVNWDNINPCLITSYTHGPCVVDFIITVKKGAPYYKVEFTNNYSSEWKLDWEENFNSGTLDLKTWSKIGGPTPGNNPDWLKNMSTYDGCFDFRDGSIVLKGIRNPGEAITGDKRTYLCGGIETFNKKDFMRGKIEIRAKHTSAQGAWPALWMMPQYSTYGPSVYSEIDISEHLNYENIIYQTLHTNYTMNVNKENPLAHVTPAYTNKNDYNTYGADMGKDTVKLMFNGIVTMAYPRTGAKDQFPFNQEYFLMLDMQLGGGWVGPVTGVDLPVEMLIDWVKFYKKDEKGGTITVKNGSTTINSGGNVREGDNITVKVNPSLSCQIDKVFVNGSDITNEYLKN